MAYITLDFGSSNSGAVLNTAFEREYNPSDLIFVHKQEGDAGFTKQPTIFWIKRSLLEKTSYSESDINIFSCVFYDEEKYLEDANFIWCQNQIKKCIPALSKSRDWVRVNIPKWNSIRLVIRIHPILRLEQAMVRFIHSQRFSISFSLS